MKMIAYISSLIVVSLIASFSTSSLMSSSKTAYVNLGKIYNEFELKKSLESKYKNLETLRGSILDSLGMQLNYLSTRIQAEKGVSQEEKENYMQQYEMKRQDYLLKQKNFSESNEAAMKSYTDQIWSQINQYVKDYGKTNGYTYIFGTDGTGAMMYGESSLDITDKMVVYVNERYKGGQP